MKKRGSIADVFLLFAGIGGALALWKAGTFVYEKLEVMGLKERLSDQSDMVYYAALAVLIGLGAALVMYVLAGIGALLSLCKARAGRVIKRYSLYILAGLFVFILAGLFVLGPAGCEAFALRFLLSRVPEPERAVTDIDRDILRFLLHGVSLFCLLSAIGKGTYALSLRSERRRDKQPSGTKNRALRVTACLCCALSALWTLMFYLQLYFKFSQAGYLFSFSRALPFTINEKLFTYLGDAAFLAACYSITLAMSRRKERGFLAAFGALCLYFAAFTALKEFVVLMSRYSLYAKFISTYTLLKNPLRALCLILISFTLGTRLGHPAGFLAGGGLCALTIIQLNNSTVPFMFKSFSIAFETALPLLYILFWAAFALTSLIKIFIKNKSVKTILGVTAALPALAIAVLAVCYYAINFKSMTAFTAKPALYETLIALYLIPMSGKMIASTMTK